MWGEIWEWYGEPEIDPALLAVTAARNHQLLLYKGPLLERHPVIHPFPSTTIFCPFSANSPRIYTRACEISHYISCTGYEELKTRILMGIYFLVQNTHFSAVDWIAAPILFAFFRSSFYDSD
uniref:Uncharacterized protein n=1 Tax=Populus alba TaxID=43335 RepID=A0A4U5MWL9_POPAL|nr:hypothetical protein D5086_0000293720 [Populus alba]